MNVSEQDIRDITGAVWMSVLGQSVEGPIGTDFRFEGAVLTSCVQISGAWQGAVTIRCSMGLARATAAAMYEIDLERTSGEEIRDALGELANMVGGNVKALLTGPTELSLPIVVQGDANALSVRSVVALHTVWFTSLGEAFAVTVLARRESAGQ